MTSDGSSITSSGNELTVTLDMSFAAPLNGTVRLAAEANGPNGATTGFVPVGMWTVPGGGGCTYALTPAAQSFSPVGGSGQVAVTASNGCAWTAVSTAPWLTLSSSNPAGLGSGAVTFSVAANSTGAPRNGFVMIGGQAFPVQQGASFTCSYALGFGGQAFPAAGGTGSVSVTTNSSSCSWNTSIPGSSGILNWVTFTNSASGNGNGAVTYQVSANAGSARSGSFLVAGIAFTVEQASATVLPFAGSMAQIVSAGGWDTSLTLVNLGTAQGEARLNFYADAGSAQQLPLTFPQQPSTGSVDGSTFDWAINPGATVVLDTTGPASQAVAQGWSQLLTTGNIGAFAIFDYAPNGEQAVVPIETRNAASYLLAFDDTGPLSTGLAVANLGTSAASIGVVIRDDTGVEIGTSTVSLPAQGHSSFMLSDPTHGFPVTAGKRGTVEFDTPQGGQISVLGLRANGAAITTLPVLANVGTAGGAMAQVASGNGWQTLFTLVNAGTTPANATLKFFGDDGSPLSLPLSFPQTGATVTETSVSQTLAAGATLVVVTQSLASGASVEGSAQLSTDGNVNGFAIFQRAGQEAVVPLEVGNSSSYVLPFDNTSGLATGIALANSSVQSAAVSATLRDGTGATLATATINLPSQGHTSQMLTTWFPVAANIRGTLEFDTPSGGQIGALGIRATPAGAYTTIPVLEQ